MARNVVVTGGSRGLGLAISTTLSAAGYRVIALARKPTAQLSAALKAAGRSGGCIEFCAVDLTDIEQIAPLVRRLRTDYGSIYGLVNNAGSGIGGVLGNMRDRDIEGLVRLNTVSPMVLTKYVARSMMLAREGRIINMASIVAATGSSGLSVYGATKASLVGFTRSLARELGPLGITVNAIAPGFIDTEMTQDLTAAQREQIARRSALRRAAEAIDVARSVEFLMGEAGRNITGTVLTVDAGTTA